MGVISTYAIYSINYCAEMSNQELVNAGMKTMNETDQTIERSKQVNYEL